MVIRRLLRPAGLILLVTATIWLAAIAYWIQTRRLVTAEDVGLYLAALPIAVLLFWLLLRGTYRFATRPRTPPSGEPSPVAQVDAAAALGDDRDRPHRFALLGVGIAGAAGDAALDAYEIMKAGQVRPGPDPELRDGDGFPVRSGRAAHLDIEPVVALLAGLSLGDAEPMPDFVVRALTLLRNSMEPLTPALHAAARSGHEEGAAARRLICRFLVPPYWTPRQRQIGEAFFGMLLDHSGWPATSRVTTTVATEDGPTAILGIDAVAREAGQRKSFDLFFVAACESALDTELVDGLESSGRLFSARNQQGAVLGEAAAAVFGRHVAPGCGDLDRPLALVGPVVLGRRVGSADAGGRPDHGALAETVRHCLAAERLEAAMVAAVVSDGDQRTSRVAECAGMVTEVLAGLDPIDDCLGSGECLGWLGSAGALFALAIAASAARVERRPILLVTVSHAFDRAALIVRPDIPEPFATT